MLNTAINSPLSFTGILFSQTTLQLELLFRVGLDFFLLAVSFFVFLLLYFIFLPLFLLSLLIGNFVIDKIVKGDDGPDDARDVHHQHLVVSVNLEKDSLIYMEALACVKAEIIA